MRVCAHVIAWAFVAAVLVIWPLDAGAAFLVATAGNVTLTAVTGVLTFHRTQRGTLIWIVGLAMLLSIPSTIAHAWVLLYPGHPLHAFAVITMQVPAAVAILLAGFSAYRPAFLITTQVLLEAVMLASSGIAALWYVGLSARLGQGESWVTIAVLCTNALIAGVIFVITARNPQPVLLRLGTAAVTLIVVDALTFVLRTQHDISAVVPVAIPGLVAWAVVMSTLPDLHKVRDSSDVVLVRSDMLREVVVGGTVGVLIVLVVVSNIIEPRVGPFEWGLIGTFIIAMWLRDLLQARHSTLLLGGMRDLALHDSLTGLLNRRALETDIEWPDQRNRQAVSMLTIDIDQFKAVNDLIGHETGNKLLVRVAALLRDTAREDAVAYRTGGDEFVVIAEQHPERAEALAARIVDGVHLVGADLPGVSKLNIGASVGVKHLPANASADDLRRAMVQSGHAMRSAKRHGRGRVVVFDGQLEDAYQRRKLIELHLREICASDRPVGLQFQPILDLATGRVAGVEALARFSHPVLGAVPPQEFIDVAEGCGLITTLGDRITRQAIAQMTAPGMLGRDIFLSINVSVLQLREVDFAGRILSLLAEHGVPRRNLVIEVTESVFVDPASVTAATLRALSDAGVQLAIDDFGAGATSVGYLHSLPVSLVKIDRSIIKATSDRRTATGILRGIVAMARSLDLAVAFEGVEKELHEQVARDLCVQYGQGWLYSPAVSGHHLPQVIDELDARGRAAGQATVFPRLTSAG